MDERAKMLEWLEKYDWLDGRMKWFVMRIVAFLRNRWKYSQYVADIQLEQDGNDVMIVICPKNANEEVCKDMVWDVWDDVRKVFGSDDRIYDVMFRVD